MVNFVTRLQPNGMDGRRDRQRLRRRWKYQIVRDQLERDSELSDCASGQFGAADGLHIKTFHRRLRTLVCSTAQENLTCTELLAANKEQDGCTLVDAKGETTETENDDDDTSSGSSSVAEESSASNSSTEENTGSSSGSSSSQADSSETSNSSDASTSSGSNHNDKQTVLQTCSSSENSSNSSRMKRLARRFLMRRRRW